MKSATDHTWAWRGGLPVRAWQLLVVAISWGAVGAAYVSQHHFGMAPCPWCILQRVIFLALGAVALCAALIPWAAGRWITRCLGLALAALGVGVAAWQNQVAAQSASCALTPADRFLNAWGLPELWPDLFEPRASCADAAVTLAGLPYEAWSALLFVLIGAIFVRLLTRPAPSDRA